jgi:glucose-1-phosphate cytidylyltransferase
MSELTAIVLCGGKGHRLKPLTDELPKPLLLLNGRPLLDYLLRYLGAAGISRFVLCTGYRAEAIERFVRENFDDAGTITCVNSGDVSITDRLLNARNYFTGPALICYGDTLANVDLAALQAFHQSSGALATLTTYPLQSPFGIVGLDSAQRITHFVEKPWLPYWINIGFFLCEPQALDFLELSSDMVAFLSSLATAGTVRMYVEIAPMSASVIFEKLCSIASAIGPAACARPGTLPVRRYWTSCCCVQPPRAPR